MILNSVDQAQNIYRQARATFNLTYTRVSKAKKDRLYRKTISILDTLVYDLSYSTYNIRYGLIPGDLNGLIFVLNAAWDLREDVWHRFLKVGNGNYKEDYLSSYAWWDKRYQVMQRDDYKCTCGSQATEVHHKHYDNIGREQLEDLVALCSTCHNKCKNNSTKE